MKGVSPELSYYRRQMATPEGRARIALIRRTQRRARARLMREIFTPASMAEMQRVLTGQSPNLPQRPPVGAFGRPPRRGSLF
jgi:hypothetical protein